MSERPTAPTITAPPIPKGTRSPRATVPDLVALDFGSGVTTGSDRIVIYGTGGIGKSTLAAFLPAPYFLDVESSTKKLDVSFDRELRAAPSWPMLRGKLATLAKSPPKGLRSVVVDTATVAEALAEEHVIATRPTEKGRMVDSIEGYGWGKGRQYVFEEFGALLADLDRVNNAGLNVCLIAHDVSTEFPNPAGPDYIRWEPFLYHGDKRGRSSIRNAVKNWADHVIFVGYDVSVEEGKGLGSGTRTLYTKELGTHVAKSRSAELAMPFNLQDPGALWRELGIS